MLKKAVRICDAKFGTMHLYEEGKLRLVAAVNVPATFEEVRRDKPLTPAPGGIFDQVIKSRTTVHLPDPAATKLYADRHPRIIEAVELGGIRTVVAVPMFKENTLIGMINIHRREVRPFTDEQIALVTIFAAQAVIAIEDARLFNELRQRTAELTESLEQQAATSEVLQVISSTPGGASARHRPQLVATANNSLQSGKITPRYTRVSLGKLILAGRLQGGLTTA